MKFLVSFIPHQIRNFNFLCKGIFALLYDLSIFGRNVLKMADGEDLREIWKVSSSLSLMNINFVTTTETKKYCISRIEFSSVFFGKVGVGSSSYKPQ